MIKVQCKNLEGIVTFEADFNTQLEADAWIAESIEVERFGIAAYQEIIPAVTEIQQVVVQEQIVEQQLVVITPAELDEEGNVITPEVTELQDVVVQEEIREMQEIVLEAEQVINHPATYTVDIVDITLELEQKQKLTTRANKRAFGEHMIDVISSINESANVNEATLEALILDQDFLVIREHLYSGSLKSAYNKILASEVKILTVFSQVNLDLVKAQLLAKLQELGEL